MSDSIEQVAAALRGLQSNQIRVLTGTVIGAATDANVTPVRLDNDGTDVSSKPVTIPSICGLLTVGTRVSILTVPPAGMIIVGEIGATYNTQLLWDYFITMTTNPVWMDRRIYTTNDTWNKPTSPLFLGVQVMIQSGGGGSGATTTTSGGSGSCSSSAGGQGGGYIEILVLATALSNTVSVTVGAGGTAGATVAGTGGTGGTSSFGAYGSIPGGVGGTGAGETTGGQSTSNGGSGSQAASLAGGAVLIDYQQGDDGGTGTRFRGGAETGFIMPGFGGGSRMSGMTRVQGRSSGQIAPSAGWPFGGGASGRGADGVSISAGNGSAGAQGIVIVKEVYRT